MSVEGPTYLILRHPLPLLTLWEAAGAEGIRTLRLEVKGRGGGHASGSVAEPPLPAQTCPESTQH